MRGQATILGCCVCAIAILACRDRAEQQTRDSREPRLTSAFIRAPDAIEPRAAFVFVDGMAIGVLRPAEMPEAPRTALGTTGSVALASYLAATGYDLARASRVDLVVPQAQGEHALLAIPGDAAPAVRLIARDDEIRGLASVAIRRTESSQLREIDRICVWSRAPEGHAPAPNEAEAALGSGERATDDRPCALLSEPIGLRVYAGPRLVGAWSPEDLEDELLLEPRQRAAEAVNRYSLLRTLAHRELDVSKVASITLVHRGEAVGALEARDWAPPHPDVSFTTTRGGKRAFRIEVPDGEDSRASRVPVDALIVQLDREESENANAGVNTP